MNNLSSLSSEAKGNAPAAAIRSFAADVAPITRTCHASLCDRELFPRPPPFKVTGALKGARMGRSLLPAGPAFQSHAANTRNLIRTDASFLVLSTRLGVARTLQRWPDRCLPGLPVGAASIPGPQRAPPIAFGPGGFGQKTNNAAGSSFRISVSCLVSQAQLPWLLRNGMFCAEL